MIAATVSEKNLFHFALDPRQRMDVPDGRFLPGDGDVEGFLAELGFERGGAGGLRA